MSLLWKLILIIIFYFILLIIDIVVFKNKISDFKIAFKDKVFQMLFVFSLILGIVYYFIKHDFFITIIFLMYTTFIEKLIVRKM